MCAIFNEQHLLIWIIGTMENYMHPSKNVSIYVSYIVLLI